jgi:hypothetical protein
VRAVYPDAGNRFALPFLLEENLAPWTVTELWLCNNPHPNHYSDVTDTFPTMMTAVHAHHSQTAHRPELTEQLRRKLAANAASAGFSPGRLAEDFRIVRV